MKNTNIYLYEQPAFDIIFIHLHDRINANLFSFEIIPYLLIIWPEIKKENILLFIRKNEKAAIVWRDKTISYINLLRNINYYSSINSTKSVKKIAIFSSNRPEWVFAFYSAWKNGAIVVPIDSLATPHEVAYMLNDCEPEVIFYSSDTYPVFKEAKELLNYEISAFNIDSLVYNPAEFSPDEIRAEEIKKTAVIIYTSGTTGSPKGVMLSFDNLLANIEAVTDDIPIFTSSRNVLVLLPLHHIFPLVGSMIAPLYSGSTIAISPSMNSEDIISTIQRNKVAIIIGVPRLYASIRQGILNQINENPAAKFLFKIAGLIKVRSLSKVIFNKVHAKFGGKIEYLVCGGAKLSADIAKDFKTLGFEILEGFGMTEAAPMITFTRPGNWKIGSAGQPLQGLELSVINGEIAARGRNIMQGYYNRPEETAQVIKDGWLYTGDMGYLDNNNFIFVTGRTKEIIVLSNGKNINPEEIENKIKSYSDFIMEVGVFEQDDSLAAAIFPNFKMLKEKGIVNFEEMFRWEVIDKYNRRVSPYKKITKLTLCKNELPKTRLDKIKRYKLKDLSGEAVNRKPVEEPEYEEYTIIRDFLRNQKNKEIFPGDHFEIDLGLDSLDKINLQVFLESTFGTKLHDDILLHHSTVEKLSLYMREKKNKIQVEIIKWSEILREKHDLQLPESWFTQNLLKNISKFLFKFYFRLKGEGIDNLPEEPFIIAPNHQSFFDGLFVSMFLKNKIMKNTYFYAKEKHLKNRLVRAFANRHNVIVMDINRDLKNSLQKLAALLKSGKNVIIFPEGTRSFSGDLGVFKKSFAILSRELNVPVVPVLIKGAIKALPRGSFIPRPWKKINIKFLKPVYPEEHSYETLINLVYQKLSKELA